MILAAGKGERMRPLTDHTPKPLLQAGGKALIEHTLERMATAGFTEIIINTAHLGEQIPRTLGRGERYGVRIEYSYEGSEPLETAGGIVNALPLLGDEPFLVVNGDIACDFDFANLNYSSEKLAHLVLIANPEHHAQGDFCLQANGTVTEEGEPKFTFSGIGIYHPKLFDFLLPGVNKLGPLLRQVMASGQVSGQYHPGFWMDIGTPQRLQELDQYLIGLV